MEMNRNRERTKEDRHSKLYQQGEKSNAATAAADRKIEHARCTNEIQSLDVFTLRAWRGFGRGPDGQKFNRPPRDRTRFAGTVKRSPTHVMSRHL